ncbi:hypothetical protein GF377_10110, partial [candidate division GN15 bacterium]|nr:hypothetical protein [candidate division GN15 bacterium]
MNTGLLAAGIGLVGLIFAILLFVWIRSRDAGTDVMKDIAGTIHHGAMVFLRREYTILAIFILIVFA